MEYQLRDATLADVSALAQLHVQTFGETHGGGPSVDVRTAQWTEILGKPKPQSFCIVLQTQGGDLIGFVRGIKHTDAALSEFEGELNKIYLLRAYHRQGLGKRLLCAAASRFIEEGLGSMLLFGDAANRSNAFYEAMGAERLYSNSGEFHGGYGWRDLRSLVAASCAPNTNRIPPIRANTPVE
jgi:ribosomal protein S18 acetylase RimI-like enzyme